MLLNKNNIKLILKHNKNATDWLDPLNRVLPEYEINSPLRVAAFMAQTAYESCDYTVLEENLNYSASRLCEVFRKYFANITEAESYEHNKEKIANRVYANRMGNGDEASGDGWKYRGRGIIQITGKDNYYRYSDYIEGSSFSPVDGVFPSSEDLAANPDLLLIDKNRCVATACWFWEDKELNELADNKAISEITRRINGGNEGIEERWRMFNEILEILG